MVKRVNGLLLDRMLRNGLANLHKSQQKINDLNVFPVPDGDTGTNMSLTLGNGLKNAPSCGEVGLYLKEVSEGMLLGARGNSGVILSQIFKGIAAHLASCRAANIVDLRNAFTKGYQTAYQAVVHPVEGTMLTVAREGIELIRGKLDKVSSVEGFFSLYIAAMKESLERTPQLLAVLKEYGVVDSGAVGYITLVEGMYLCLCDKMIEDTKEEMPAGNNMNADVSANLFHEFSAFKEGYCTEFVLQRLKTDGYNQNFKLEQFKSDLEQQGNSIVVSEDGLRIKVHIHTLKPGRVIALAQEYGEFISFKLENMQIQHNEFMAKRKKAPERAHSAMAVVAVANGEGIHDQLEKLGCAVIIEGTDKMNPSAQDFIDAFDEANADMVVVLPNNRNTIRSAEQAASIYTKAEVRILPTNSMVEGYYAMSMDIPFGEPETRMKSMLTGAGNITTLLQTQASKDYEHNGIGCKAGEEILLINSALVYSAGDYCSSILGGLKKVEEIDDKESCIIFRGKGVDEACESELEDAINSEFPDLELIFVYGGQEIYSWMIGVI